MKRTRLLLAATAAAVALSACGQATTTAGDAQTAAASSPGDTEAAASSVTTSEAAATALEAAATTAAATHEDATDHEWDAADEVGITLDADAITVEGAGVVVDGTTATITAPGTYRLGGAAVEAQVVVDSAADGVVRLILDGVDIASSTGAPVVVLDADKVVVVLADGTTSTLRDASSYADTSEEAPTAPLYSTADLTIAGGGSLVVHGNANDGIVSKDGLIIAGGTITVDAVDDGIRGKDYLVVEDGTITVTAGGDGLKADNEDDTSLGFITISGGTLAVTSGGDAAEAATGLTVSGGSISIKAGGGSDAVPGATSAKGLKGLASVTIVAGTIVVDAADDAIHSNGAVTIAGGDLLLATGDDGVHADESLAVSGGTIEITTSYEGLESAIITIDAGGIEIHSSDDGINVAGGADGSGGQRPPGGGGPGDAFAASGDYHLYLNGGTVLIYAQGDGLDSNGTVAMTGGTVIVHGPTANNNGAIDAGSFDISGGFLVAVGSAGMAEGVDASVGASISIRLGATQEAGTVVHIESSDGVPVLTFEPAKPYAALTFYSADLVAGDSYDVYFGGTASGDALGGLFAADTYSSGSLAGTVTAG